MRFTVSIFLLSFLFFGCNQEKNSINEQSNTWELEILDSIQVDYLGTADGGNFYKNQGIIFNFKENKLIKFDQTGKILNEISYPTDGPEMVHYPMQLKMTDEGTIYAASFVGWLYELNSDLSFNREIKLEFPTEARDGGGTLRTIDTWRDYLILYYPGRDGTNPYDPHFVKNHFLLEKINPENGQSEPIIKIPPISRYASDAYYERPFIQFGIEEDLLFLILDKEPMVHVYDLCDGEKYLNTIHLSPSKFLDNGEHEKAYQYISGRKMLDGKIRQFFPTPEGIPVIYEEGIDEDIFAQYELNLPKNFPLYSEHQRQILKIIQSDSTLSNEIVVPNKIDRILNIESLNEPFFALRNDEFIGEEQDYLTFYKLQLKRK